MGKVGRLSCFVRYNSESTRLFMLLQLVSCSLNGYYSNDVVIASVSVVGRTGARAGKTSGIGWDVGKLVGRGE
jgi:hypothetical protein